MKHIRKKLLLLVLAIVVILISNVYASEEFISIEKSEEFQKWENLSDEERKSVIQPTYNDLKISDSVKRSTYNQLLKTNSLDIESRYLFNNNIVKHQRKTNLCWAFAFTSSLESTINKKYNKPSLEYSPLYIDYNVSKNFMKSIGSGGNFSIASASVVSGNGAVYETDMPFSAYYDEQNNPQSSYYLSYNNADLSNIEPKVKINETTRFASIYKSYSSDNSITYKDSSKTTGATTYTEDEVNAIRTQVKKHIKEHGGVVAGTCTKNIANDYNSETHAFYSNSSIYPSNHAVTIVGWDDNYSKTNFVNGKQPVNDGAYIVLNSGGSEFGENGYYYISYDDVYIEQFIQGIDDLQEFSEEEKGYNNLYQYDELGQSLSFYFLNDNKTNYVTEGYLANKFTRENTNKDEYISEVGIYVPTTEGIEVYVDYMDADMKNYKLVASYTGSNALEPGYHALKLASPLKIQGEEFAVIVKYMNTEGAKYAIECNLNSSGISEKESYYSTAIANDGESYISNDGTNWTDINKYQVPSNGKLTTYKDTNACIKAFTITSEKPKEIPVESVEITEESITINKGNTANIVATVKPDNATNKNVTWSSLNEDIATVSSGVIKGEKVGTTTVTVTTEDGQKIDSVNVTVIDNKESEIVDVTGVKLDAELEEGASLKINKGSTYAVNAIVEPSNATNKNITWISSDENIATVANGIITGISQGTATITVTTEDGNKTASVKVEVVNNIDIKVESVRLNKDTLNLEVGDTTNLVVTFNPVNANNKNVTWSSSNEKVASISDTGIIEALEEGKTTITVISEDGNKTAKCELTVVKKTNSYDDIYKSDENVNTTNKKDNTIAKVELPNTGLRIILIVLVAGAALIGVISFIKYKKYSEIK